MKRMSRMDSKAGIFQKENSLMRLKNYVSKSVFILLILITGLSTMSFNQDDTSANGIDTNLNTSAKELTIVAPKSYGEVADIRPSGYKKTADLAIPGVKAMAAADREVFRSFRMDINAVTISMANFTVISLEADKEMNRNFVLSTLHPLADNSGEADRTMIDLFTKQIILKSIMPATSSSGYADASMVGIFMQENFKIRFAQMNSVDALISDSEMTDAFEEENGKSYGSL